LHWHSYLILIPDCSTLDNNYGHAEKDTITLVLSTWLQQNRLTGQSIDRREKERKIQPANLRLIKYFRRSLFLMALRRPRLSEIECAHFQSTNTDLFERCLEQSRDTQHMQVCAIFPICPTTDVYIHLSNRIYKTPLHIHTANTYAGAYEYPLRLPASSEGDSRQLKE